MLTLPCHCDTINENLNTLYNVHSDVVVMNCYYTRQ